MKASRHQLTAIALVIAGATVGAQPGAVPAARVSILIAEDRRAPTPRDLATLRAGVRNGNSQTAQLAIRALGRLERPALIADLLPALRFRLPEMRAEAANAIGQAAQGWAAVGAKAGALTPASVLTALVARLEVEEEPSVRAALCETIGRLPYGDAVALAARAEAALVALARRSDAVNDRLGAAKGLEALTRINRERLRPSAAAVDALRVLSGMPAAAAPSPGDAVEVGAADPSQAPPRLEPDPLRDSRVRRLALETLITAEIVDEDVLARAAGDADPQVRRLAMRAAAASGGGASRLIAGLADPAAMVRLEALRGLQARGDPGACDVSLEAASDVDRRVALLALDQLGLCGAQADAVALLERVATDRSPAESPRGWHRGAHALVALASAAPDRAAAAIAPFVDSPIWQERVYAARAAAARFDRAVLETLAVDADDNVVEAALTGLAAVMGHAVDPLYLAALTRSGYHAVRAAALALDGTPAPAAAVPALQAALQRLMAEGRDNSVDTRAALAATLTNLGAPTPPSKPPAAAAASGLNAAELRRLAAPRARVAIRNVGTFDLALFTAEAPATVLRFAALAESGYYDGLTFHRVVPNFVIQGGSPGANEYVGDGSSMRDEVGLWPHVRGTVGISTRGRDTGDAQIFINLVDNPRFDHEYTVFAQVLNGVDVVDQILEGDVIERIEIIP